MTVSPRLVLLRFALYPVVLLVQRLWGEDLLRDVERVQLQRDHERRRELDEARRKAERAAARAEKIRRAEAARAAKQRERDERLAAAAREKRDRKTLREREKARHRRAKRRAAFVAQVKRRIGLGQ